MASQQAWDDFESVRRLVDVVNAQKNGLLRASLHELNAIFTAIAGDPARAAEVSALADSHPVETAAHLAEEAGKLLTMRAWLIANGYLSE